MSAAEALRRHAYGRRNNPGAEDNVARALGTWRELGAPIVHVRHESMEPGGRFVRGRPGFDFKPEAQPLGGEEVITKQANSAFIGTDLEARLRDRGVETVALAGLTTDHCCSSTARMTANLGFETWALGDAMATFERRDPEGEQLDADLMHRTALARLSGEFAEVLDTEAALERLQGGSAAGLATLPAETGRGAVGEVAPRPPTTSGRRRLQRRRRRTRPRVAADRPRGPGSSRGYPARRAADPARARHPLPRTAPPGPPPRGPKNGRYFAGSAAA